jgi:DNA-directed RNA polymerase specialized sigma24 family protein
MGFEPSMTPGPAADAPPSANGVVGDARTPIDKATIAAARDGNRDALAALWRHHAPHVTRLLIAQRAPDSTVLAERIWRRVGRLIDRFDGDGEAFRRWVLRIASTAARDARVPESTKAAGATADGSSIAPDLVDASLADHLSVISQLPAPTAEAVMLRHVHGLSVADIALITDASEGIVRQLLRDGMNLLRSTSSPLDPDGRPADRRTESIVTEPLRQAGTSSELAGEPWGVDAVIAGMADPEPLTATPTTGSSRRRRAVAVVAAGAIVIVGTATMSTLVRDGDSAASVATDASTDASAGRTGSGSGAAQRNGNPAVVRTPAVAAPASDGGDVATAPGGAGELVVISVTPLDTEDLTSQPASAHDAPSRRPSGRTPAAPDPEPRRTEPTAPENTTAAPDVPAPPTTMPPNRNVDPRDDALPLPATPTTSPTTTEPVRPVPPRPITTSPPTTRPPVTSPPTTRPPVTSPPTTRPPATSPPTTRPPVTSPPTTDPAPPTTRPPVTTPPTTTRPDDDPTPSSPRAPRPPGEGDDEDG